MPKRSYVPSDKRLSDSDDERGVEVELCAVELAAIPEVLQCHFGGSMEERSVFGLRIENTEFGNFGIEVDGTVIKWLGRQMRKRDHPLAQWQHWATEAMSLLAMNLVPCAWRHR